MFLNNSIVSQCEEKCKPVYTIQKGVKLPEHPISSCVGRLFNFFEAEGRGLKSASVWKKQKMEIIPGAEPVGFVASMVKAREYLRGTEYAVLELLDGRQYRVVVDGWFVYSVDQTRPKTKRSKSTACKKAPDIPPSLPPSDESSMALIDESLRHEIASSGWEELPETSFVTSNNYLPLPEILSFTSNNHLSLSLPLLSPSSLLSSSPSPLVLTIRGDTAPNPNSSNSLRVNSRPEKIGEVLGQRHRKRGRKPSAYVPVNWTEDLGDFQEEAYCFLHLMRVYQFVNGLDDDDWVDMAFEQSNRLIPNYPKLLNLLLDTNIIERTTVLEHPLGFEVPRGIEGITMYGIHRAYAYRLTNLDYRHGRWTKRPITKKSILARLDDYENAKYPVQRWLKENNTHLEVIDPPGTFLYQIAETDFRVENTGSVDHRTKAYTKMLKLIQDRTWLCTFDPFARRYHNNATALKRELRQFLRVDGKALVEIDIKAAQPLFLGLLAKQKGIVEADRFLRVCEGDLYQYLASKGGWGRQQVKEQLMQRALFSPNNSRWQKTTVKKLFDKEFPAMARFFKEAKYGRKTKDNPKPHNKLARMAQKAEVNFVIFTVCERIRRERPDCWLTTIHDSVLCLPEDGEYVRNVMADEFEKLGIKPTLEVKELCP